MEQVPEAGVEVDLAQLTTGEGQTSPAVLVQEGEKVEETLAVELSEMHGEKSRNVQRDLVPGAETDLLVGSNNEPTACIVWPRYMMPPQAHGEGPAHIRR